MKKGFTLIEILAVTATIGLIFILVVPKIISSINSKKNDIDSTTSQIIINAAELYIFDHPDKFNKIEGSVYCLPILTLVKEEYLESSVKNIVEDKEITNSKSIKIEYNKNFSYEIVDKKDCLVN